MKKRSVKKILRSVTYMQVSLILFGLSFLICLVLFIRSILSGGGLGTAEGILGITALLFSIAGFITPLYGRFVVHAQARPDYRLGLLLNGAMMLILFFFYFLGL